jgi:hypothetical protein
MNDAVYLYASNYASGNYLVIHPNGTNYSNPNIRINYGETSGGYCYSKQFCNSSLSSQTHQSCSYAPLSTDTAPTAYYVKVCDDENSCSISREGTFYVNNPPDMEWVNLTSSQGNNFTDNSNLNCTYLNKSDNYIKDSGNLSFTFRWFLNRTGRFGIYNLPSSENILTNGNTQIGDQWICEVTPYDGFVYGTPLNSSPVRTILSSSLGNGTPIITGVSDNSNESIPINVGDTLTFTLYWSDADSNEKVRAYICNSSNIESSGCSDFEFARTDFSSTNPLIISYSANESLKSSESYVIMVCDDSWICSNIYDIYGGGYSGNFTVNHRPNATDIQISYTDSTSKLICNYDIVDDDSDTKNISASLYKWYLKSNSVYTEIPGQTTENLSSGFSEGNSLICSVKVSDEHGFRDDEYINSSEFIVSKAPISPYLWPIPDVTNENRAIIVGFTNESRVTVTAYARQSYEVPKSNTTDVFGNSTLLGTAASYDKFAQNMTYFVINSTYHSYFTVGRFVEFGNHYRDHYYRYNISAKNNLFDGTYRIDLHENLSQTILKDTLIYVYNSSIPNGWFNMTLELFNNQNIIRVLANNTNISLGPYSQSSIFVDIEKPSVNVSLIPSVTNERYLSISFIITDNYRINLSTLLLNLSNATNITYYHTNLSIYNLNTRNISCTGNDTYKVCNITLPLINGSDYNLTFWVNDSVNNQNISRTSLRVNTEIPSAPYVYTYYGFTNQTQLSVRWAISGSASNLAYSVGTLPYPTYGWNLTTNGWINATATDISNSNLTTSALNVVENQIYFFNIRYKTANDGLWSLVGVSPAILYRLSSTPNSGPSGVIVSAPIAIYSKTLTGSWTSSLDDKYSIEHYDYAVGSDKYPNNNWNTTTNGWINNGLSASISTILNLTNGNAYYINVRAVNTAGQEGPINSSQGTTYFDLDVPITTVIQVDNDTDSTNGWLDDVNDNQTLIKVQGNEYVSCFYSQYDKDYIDYDSTKDTICDVTTYPAINVSCNLTFKNGTALPQATYTHHIVCQDNSSNMQASSDNTHVTFTINYIDNPQILNITPKIFNQSMVIQDRKNPYTKDILNCTGLFVDYDGNETINTTLTQFRWYNNSELISGETNAALNLSAHSFVRGSSVMCGINITDITGLSSGWINSTIFESALTINNTPPYQPTLLTPYSTYHKDSIIFNWTNVTDNDDDSIVYELQISNRSDYSVQTNFTQGLNDRNITLSIANTAIWKDGTYYWRIIACDNSNYTLYKNNCSYSSQNFSFVIDQNPPNISIILPEINKSQNQDVTIDTNISDINSPVNFAYYNITNISNDVVTSGNLNLTNNWDAIWQTNTNISDGNYTLIVFANNTAGNIKIERRNFTLNNNIPLLYIDTLPYTFREQYLKDNFNLNLRATNLANTSYRIVNSQGVIMQQNSSNATYDLDFNFTEYVNISGWAEGFYTINFTAIDEGGNRNNKSSWFAVDHNAPLYSTINQTPDPIYTDTNITLGTVWFNNSYIEGSNKFGISYVYIEHNATGIKVNLSASVTGNYYYVTISGGLLIKNTFVVWKSYAIDNAGNINDSMLYRNFTIQDKMPLFNYTNFTISDQTWPEDTSYSSIKLNISYSDLDNDNLTFSAIELPKGALFYESFDNQSYINAVEGVSANISYESGKYSNSVSVESETINLLYNPSLEVNYSNGDYIQTPKNWTRVNLPAYNQTGFNKSGFCGVKVNIENYYYQNRSVSANAVYSLSAYLKADTGTARGRLHIDWYKNTYPSDTSPNKNNSYISTTLNPGDNTDPARPFVNSTDFTRYELTVTSPSNAAYARIYLDSDNTSYVIIDDVQLESKAFARSYTNGKRSNGMLSYQINPSYNNRSRINSDAWTVEMWVKPKWNQSDSEVRAFLYIQDYLFIGKTSAQNLVIGLNNTLITAAQDWVKNRWYFIAATWNSSSGILNLYANSEPKGTATLGIVPSISAENIYVGSMINNYPMDAVIDDLVIYNYAKSQAEITGDNITPISENKQIDIQVDSVREASTFSNVTFVPYANFSGERRVQFFASDGINLRSSNIIKLNVTPVNDAPNITTIAAQTWLKNTNHTLNLSLYFGDVDGDILSYASTTPSTVRVEIYGNIARLIPATDFEGLEYVTFTASDASYSTDSNVITLNVVPYLLNSTIINSTINGTYYNNTNNLNNISGIIASNITTSNISSSTLTLDRIESSNITNSVINNSNIINSVIINSTIINSTVINTTLIKVTIIHGYVDPSSVVDSYVNGESRIINSNISSSTITKCNISNSNIVNSNVSKTNISNANVTNNIIYSGTIRRLNGTMYDATANGAKSLVHIINYAPVAVISSITPTVSGSATLFTSGSTDANADEANNELGDSLNFTWFFGTGENVTANSTTNSYTYASAGTYTVTLLAQDKYNENSTVSTNVTITAPSPPATPVSYSSGGGGGGTVCKSNWSCSEWSSCTNAKQTRTCTDLKHCKYPSNKPQVSRACALSGITGQAVASCTDSMQNQGESGIDCGGPCRPCTAAVETCFDRIRNQGETGIDCGGPCKPCSVKAATCTDGMQNQDETGIDCGGQCGPCKEIEKPAAIQLPKIQLPSLNIPKPVLYIIPGVLLAIALAILIIKKRESQAQLLLQQQDPAERLNEYITTALENGKSFNEIQVALIQRGWPKKSVDSAAIDHFVRHKLYENLSLVEIRRMLIQAGWDEYTVDAIIKKYK